MKHLYLIRDGESSYKIGSANNPKNRLNELQVGSCRKLVLVWSVQTELAIWIEGYLHGKFRSQRIMGEWFALHVEEVQWIMSLTVEEIHRLWKEKEIHRLRKEEKIHGPNKETHHRREDVTGMELALLQILWERGPAMIRQLTEVLYPGGGMAQYSTVQKLLECLEAKGCIHRDRTLAVHTFTAAITREELFCRRLRDMAEKLCGGSLMPLVTRLVRMKGLTSRECQELRDLIDEPEPKCKGTKRSR